MKKLLLLALLLTSLSTLTAQELLKANVDATNGYVVPEYPGGIKAFNDYIATEMKLSTNKKGKLIVSFIVEKDGSVSNINIIESLGRKIDKRVKKIISQSPKWKPGYQDGILVRAKYTFPITFN